MTTETTERQISASEVTRCVYLLYFAVPLFAGAALIGFAMARKHECRGSAWLASHLRFQQRLFWWGFWLVLAGSLTTFFWLGWLILLGALVFWVHQSLRGYRLFLDRQPCPQGEGGRSRTLVGAADPGDQYDWDPNSDEAPWAVRVLHLGGIVEGWRDFKEQVRRKRADLPEQMLGPEFDPLTAVDTERLVDRLAWELFEVWEDAAPFIWLLVVLGAFMWLFAMVASPLAYVPLTWISAYLFLRIGLSIGLVAGAYVAAGWRFAWAHHKQKATGEAVATPLAFLFVILFGALGGYLAVNIS